MESPRKRVLNAQEVGNGPAYKYCMLVCNSVVPTACSLLYVELLQPPMGKNDHSVILAERRSDV